MLNFLLYLIYVSFYALSFIPEEFDEILRERGEGEWRNIFWLLTYDLDVMFKSTARVQKRENLNA